MVSLLRDIPTFSIYCVQIRDILFPFQISRLEDLLASKTTALRELVLLLFLFLILLELVVQRLVD